MSPENVFWMLVVERRDNGDAHLKRQVMGREVVVAITDGRFDFGPWEQVFYGEFDGRRRQTKSLKKLCAYGFIAW
jgi:thiamine phosphate synthase YjbQ (UPF0047 family)